MVPAPPRPRYAIYFTPAEESALCRFGSEIIGYDCYAGGAASGAVWSPLVDLLSESDFTEPRRYGFHATLRAPFELRDGTSLTALMSRARDFARTQQPVHLATLTPQRMGGFIALTCPAPPPELTSFAADCVRSFEPYRAPLSETDRQRRLQAKLSPRQTAYLDEWGYPYVLEEFKFHMTLTGNLPAEVADAVLDRITAAWAPVAGPVTLDAITVLEQSSREARWSYSSRGDCSSSTGRCLSLFSRSCSSLRSASDHCRASSPLQSTRSEHSASSSLRWSRTST